MKMKMNLTVTNTYRGENISDNSIWVWTDSKWSKDYKTNKPVITVFARSYLDHKVTKQFHIKHIKPYFYALNQTVQYDKSLYRVIEGDWVIDALGRRVQQTYCQLPSDIPKIREYYEITDEADIMFDKRYLIDNNISYTFTEDEGVLSSCDVDSIQVPRTMWFDIEVRSPSNVMPKVINPIYPIVSIQIMDSYSKRIIVITNGVPKVADDQIACDTEKELFEVFMGLVQKLDPDVLSGWYCIPEDTYIETANGFTKIKDIDIDDELDTSNAVINKVNTGFKQCRRVTTSLGNEFTTSNEHKFLVTNPKYTYVNNTCERYSKTWKNAIDLSNIDILSMPFGEYINNVGMGLDTHKCYIMGLIYGDGSIKDKYRFSLYNKDMDLIKLSKRPYWYSKGCYITTFLRKEFENESALIVKDGYKKELNVEMISRLSLEEFCAFISGWIDSDGTFDSHTLTIADTRYKPAHSLLMKDFGILTSIHKCNYELNNEIHTCYKQRIMCALPIVWELIRKYSLYHYDTYIERLPSCKSKTKLSHFKYTFSENLDIVYVKVRSNTDCGYYKCYDIETSKHEFSIGCVVHNCNGFDLPYIILRAIRLNIDTRKLGRSDSQQCYAKQGNKAGNDFTERWSISVPGRQCFDLLDAFKKYYAPKGGLDAYDLKSVISSDKVMGSKGFKYTDYGGSIDSLFTTCKWDIFLQYCRYDVIALDTIDTELKLIEFYEQLRKTSGVKLEETLLNSRVIESMIMRAGIKPMPTKNYKINITESFEGAVVLTPPVGIHKNVGVVDLAALYPNIIVGFNISPDIDGVIPRVIKTVMEERDVLRRLKNEGKADSVMKNKEQVLKFLANSFYGVLGWTKFRLYNIEQAAFITRTGRELNGFLQQIAKENGHDTVYGDSVVEGTQISVNGNLVPIESLFTKVDKIIGYKEYCNLTDVYADTIDSNDQSCIKNVPYVMRHKCNKQVYRVWLSTSEYLDVTEDHSLFGYINKCKIRKGNTSNIIYVKPTEIGTICKSLIKQRNLVRTQLNSLNYSRYVYELMGFYTGDGTISGYYKDKPYYMGISMGVDSEELQTKLLDPLIEEGFILTNYPLSRSRVGDIKFRCKDVSLLVKHVHPLLFRETEPNIQSYLCGLFSADGTVSIRSNNPIIRLTSIDNIFLKDVQKLLLMVGISSSIFKERNTNKYNGKDSGTYSNHLVIKNVVEFKNTIGFILQRKQDIIRNLEYTQVTGSFSDKDYNISKVMNVEPIEYTGYVYDIEVEDTHRFFANTILVHNTDSIFIKDVTIERGYELEKIMNERLAEWSRQHGSTVNFTLKFEKLYRTILFKKAVSGKMAKKRYAGHLIFKDGQTVNQLDMTGGETRRSDQSEITKGMLMTFLTKLLLEDKKDEALKDIKILVRDILRGKISLHKLSIPKGIKDANRNDPWNRGVSLLQKQFKINIPEGKKARLIYIKHNSPPELCIYEDVDEDMIKSTFDIDYTMCMKKTVEKKMRTYIESIGESWEGIVLGQKTFW